jgi:hypothetical protein
LDYRILVTLCLTLDTLFLKEGAGKGEKFVFSHFISIVIEMQNENLSVFPLLTHTLHRDIRVYGISAFQFLLEAR